MSIYYDFRSETDPELHGFTDDPTGEKLPPENKPWILTGQMESDEKWDAGVSRAAVLAGVMENGFFLWDKKEFGHTPSAKPTIESDRVEGTWVYDVRGNHIGTIKRLIIEKTTGRVLYVDMTFGGFLGVGTHHYTIPWEKLSYDAKLGGYRTDITEDQVRGTSEIHGDAEVWPKRQRTEEARKEWLFPPNTGAL
jgi:sporulation protein YlmC with PRC-barrel domain